MNKSKVVALVAVSLLNGIAVGSLVVAALMGNWFFFLLGVSLEAVILGKTRQVLKR